MRLGLCSGLLAAGLCVSSASFACAVPPPPFVPRSTGYDAIVAGKVVREGTINGIAHADVAIDRRIRGSYPGKVRRIAWPVIPGMCPSASAAVTKGDRVTVYLIRKDGKFETQGWLLSR